MAVVGKSLSLSFEIRKSKINFVTMKPVYLEKWFFKYIHSVKYPLLRIHNKNFIIKAM